MTFEITADTAYTSEGKCSFEPEVKCQSALANNLQIDTLTMSKIQMPHRNCNNSVHVRVRFPALTLGVLIYRSAHSTFSKYGILWLNMART
jgi:hypothetical protein